MASRTLAMRGLTLLLAVSLPWSFGCFPERPAEATKAAPAEGAAPAAAAEGDHAGEKKTDVAAAFAGDAKKGEETFKTVCIACHTVGEGDRTGPDLKGVTERRDHAWLEKWMKDPIAMAKTDELGKKLLAEWKGVFMPPANLDDQGVIDVLTYVQEATKTAPAVPPVRKEEKIELSDADFDKGKKIFFDRCAGCHGTLRKGATGPNIEPDKTKKLGSETLQTILTNGLPGGMPPWGKLNILSKEEIELMSRYVQLPAPEPPQLPLEQIKATWKLDVPLAERPTEPPAGKDWENYFGVVLRDAGQVAIFDGDSYEKLAIINTGFAVHILRSSSSGRYFYAVGRDGKVSLIDLWYETPKLVSQVQGCFDARSVEGSKFKGYEDKLVIEGCYWPPQYVVYDGLTLEPKVVVPVAGETYDTKEDLEEVRVASIVASHFEPIWVVSLKESGYVAIVDYTVEGFPIASKIGAERFLHDGGWDHTQRYFIVAANMRNHMAVIDVKEKTLVTKFETGNKPHPGRGANWIDPEFGWVNATTHIGENKMTVYGADPEKRPDVAWKVVREVKIPAPGRLFVKTHSTSDWVWFDTPLSNVEEQTRQMCVYSKKEGTVHKCWQAGDRGRIVHFEYNKAGDQVWVSLWDKKGELLIYDDKTLELKKRIEGDWLVTPTGKFNVYNTAHDVY